jgi:iron complex outermembrane receptor protein
MKSLLRSLPYLSTGVSIIALAVPMSAHAQAADEDQAAPVREHAQIDEIVVTARRREEPLQDVPAAITVLSGDFLSKTNTTSVADIAKFAPSISFQSYNPRNTNLNIRGLGNNVGVANDGLDPGVGFYVDGVYYSRPGSTAIDLIDIERIEVLRGPQGTLYGRNTTAGAISVTTALPSFAPEVRAEASLGNYDLRQAKASVNIPAIDDVLAFRVSGAVTERDGTVNNSLSGESVNDVESRLVRAQMLMRPSADVSIRVIGDYSRQTPNCCAQALADIVTPANGRDFRAIAALFGYTPVIDPYSRQVVNDAPFTIDNRTGGVSAQVDYELPEALLTSVTAWRFWKYDPQTDTDFTPLDAFTRAQINVDQRQFTQEIRLASTGARTIDYVLGGYYYREEIDTVSDFGYGNAATALFLSPALPSILLQGIDKIDTNRYLTESLAAFGSMTFNVTDRLSLTGGLRYSHDDKRGSYSAVVVGGTPLVGPLSPLAASRAAIVSPGAFDVDYNEGKLSGMANVAYDVTDNLTVYATFARGNRSGGLNLTQLPPGASPVVAAETIDSYEIGSKSTWLDGVLTFNLAAFLQNDRDYQANIVNPITRRGLLANVPKARSRGIEFDLSIRPVDGLFLYSSGAWTDAEYIDFPSAPCPLEETNLAACNFSGRSLPAVPKFAVSLGGEFAQPLSLGEKAAELYLGVDYSHRSSVNMSPTLAAATLLPSLDLVNARIGMRAEDGRLDVSLFARNLFDEDYFDALSQGAGNAGLVHGQLGEPRVYGITLRFRH